MHAPIISYITKTLAVTEPNKTYVSIYTFIIYKYITINKAASTFHCNRTNNKGIRSGSG